MYLRLPYTHLGQADVILANSEFTARIFGEHFPSIKRRPRVVYPGINIESYIEENGNEENEASSVDVLYSYVDFSESPFHY